MNQRDPDIDLFEPGPRRRPAITGVAVATLLLAACPKGNGAPTAPPEIRVTPTPEEVGRAPLDPRAPVERRSAEARPRENALSLSTVHFEFDSSVLSEGARALLRENANRLEESSRNDRIILIEGHADPRGTAEYNLALGQDRAEAVRTYLTHLGVDGARLRTISYGEEIPAAPGAGESVWARSRRSEMKPLRVPGGRAP